MFGAVILVSSLACLITTIGIIVISRYETWANENAVYFMSFAAGVLISVSFMHIIPKAFEMNISAPLFMLVGFFGLYLINRFMQAYICHKYQSTNYSFGLIPMLGIGFHSFLDGVIYSVAFNVSVFTGVLAVCRYGASRIPGGNCHILAS